MAVRLPSYFRGELDVSRLVIALGGLTFLLASCSRDLSLPPAPPPVRVPVIASFTPTAAFGGDQVIVYGENFELTGNQLEFPGGTTVLADTTAEGDVRIDGGLSFIVPDGLEFSAPLLLSNTQGRSELSAATFTPLGTGHPNAGTQVATLRFRHNPVGLVDLEDNVLMGSSIFDLLVTDGKAFRRVPGRPLALKRSATPGQGLLSVTLPGRNGMMLEVDATDGSELMRSEARPIRELFILPPLDSSMVARSIGVDSERKYTFTTWTAVNGALVASAPVALPFGEVLGAAALGNQVSIIARGPFDTTFSVFSLTGVTVTRAWTPTTGAACETQTGPPPSCESPDGPVAVVAPVTMGSPPSVVVSLGSGDLLVLSAGAPRTIKLISYARINALSAAIAPGKVLFTKAVDGALFQYDLETGALDWSVQLRGEPSVIDVAADIDEIAVGNRLDNAVDVITASTGTWTGRIAFNLGVGSAEKMTGGIVAPYSYDPARWPGGTEPVPRLDLLMRNVGLVVSIDASSLEILGHLVLDSDGTAPLRLAVTHDLQTLVVHAHRLGLLEPTEDPDDDENERTERLVTPYIQNAPLDVLVMPQGQVVLTSLESLRWYEWVGSPRILQLGGELRLPTGATLMDAAVDGDEVLITWTTSTGGFGGGFYALTDFPTGTQRKPLNLGPSLKEFIGLVSMREGPAAFFLEADRPVVLGREALMRPAMASAKSSVVNRKRLAGTSPDGRYVLWLDEGSAEPMARLVKADGDGNIMGYSTYRLAGNAAGPACDPSGQWLYLPVPLLDQLEVVQ
jgi:hypothetical protein